MNEEAAGADEHVSGSRPGLGPIARDLISGLSSWSSYEDWLDSRYGTLFGRSLGGEKTGFVTVSLEQFLEWCARQGVRPSEAALDAFAVQSVPRQAHSAA